MSKQHILVVDDHELLLAGVRDILETDGYTVSTATDGVQALEVMKEIRPDLIVADIMMPRMDGFTFCEAVRTRPEWVPIPFIFLTAKANREDMLKGKHLGIEVYITKPFDPQELLIAVRARLDRAQAVRQITETEFDQLKQQIVTVLSHEMRTPLTYVRGYTELALDDISSLPPDAMQEFLLGIKRGADRLTRLVEDFLFLIQVDTGQAKREFNRLADTHHNLGTILEYTVQQCKEQATACGVTLKTTVEPDLPPVRLYEPFFIDALKRLVDNGVKFSQGDGKQVTVSARAVDDWVEIAVADQGVGISPEDIPHLFERFRQIDRERMEQQGIGLGLAITRELALLHSGEITVESELGMGSTVTIRLPVAKDVGCKNVP